MEEDRRGPLGRRLARAARLRLAIARYALRRLGPPLLAVACYAIAAALLVRWDLQRAGLRVPDLGAGLWGVFTLLFFEPTLSFPPTPIARGVFWATPVVGALLLVEGVLKIGAELFDSAARQKLWVTIVSGMMRDHVVVCGLGHVGYRVVEELLALGEDVVALEQKGDAIFVEAVRARGVPVHVGDARRDELLAACGIDRAKAIVCATDDDLANLEIALDSKRMSPKVRVVLRMFDQRLAAKVGGALELDQSFSTSALAAPLIALRATEEGVLSAYRLGEETRVTVEIAVGEAADGSTVAAVEDRARCRVVSRSAGAGAFAQARAGDALHAGDRIVIDVAAGDLRAAQRAIGSA
jgi:voltage-gated potassium channel